MKKALISPLENNRICQVEIKEFEVAPPFYWVDCTDDVTDLHVFDGLNFSVKTVSQTELNKIAIEQAKTELSTIDLASIRAMREYIASKADAPQILKDREAAAQIARGKIK